MFKCNDFIYIQMQKTASQHITKQFMQLFEGELIGHHNSATLAQLKSHRYFIGSIRNPWDWYVSLWSFGVGGRGMLANNLTRRNLFSACAKTLRQPTRWAGYQQCIASLIKDVRKWRAVYSKSDDVVAFRRWLAYMHDSKNSHALGEGYAHASKHNISTRWGFMTYRYLLLHCGLEYLTEKIDLSDFDQLQQFDHEHGYINYFIRQEQLADNLCCAIEKIKTLTEAQRDAIFSATKTNTSVRALSLADYYNQETIDLVREKDRLIIEKFNYSPPITP